MKLKYYLSLNKISSKTFANLIGVSQISISRYLNGRRVPKKKIMERIFNNTNGFVSANDFMIKNDKIENIEEKLSELKFIIRKISAGSIKFLAKAITLVESTKLDDKQKSEILLSNLPKKDNTIRIGISGVPGVGKSTFIESLGLFLIKKGLKVAVLAIDPSSKKTGGSILGDKTRMERLSNESNAFIRPSPSSGHLGGVTKSTRESIACIETGGYDVIFIETMGVGQAETAVYNMVDIFLVLLLPSGGDDLQGIKKGIIELADLLIVNKADDILTSAANITVKDYENALSIIRPVRKNWKPKVLKCSSLNNQGVKDIWFSIQDFIEIRKKNLDFKNNRSQQNMDWMWETLENKLNDFIKNKVSEENFVKKIEQEVFDQNTDPNSAANSILESFLKNYN